jgi:primary-amine oxidase
MPRPKVKCRNRSRQCARSSAVSRRIRAQGRSGPPPRPRLAFHQQDPADLPWAHPIDGVVAYVDLTQRRVIKVIDDIALPIPTERGQWDAAPYAVPPRTDLKPIEITQPEGPSFQVEGNQITWADWTFRFGFDIREGLTLHQLSIRDGDIDR